MIRAEVGWALCAFHEEYTMLSSGGPVPGASGLNELFSRPSADPPPPGADPPPPVGLGAFRDGRDLYLGLLFQEWSREIDAVGRAIPVSRYLCVRYSTASGGRVDYRGLYEALREKEPPPDGGVLRAEIPVPSAEERAALVGRFGFARAAAAAALVLDGPVAVTQAEELPVEERLAFLDAVAALLPYGRRAGLVVSAWHDGGDRHIDLAFARRCPEGATELDWRAPAAPEGNAYLNRLSELVERRSPTEVVSFLADQTEPLDEAGAEEVLRVLDELDRPERVLQAAKRGRLSHGELHWLFASGRFRELPSEDDRRSLFDALVLWGDVDDLMVVEPLWKEVGGDFESLVKAARAKLWQLEPESETVRYLWSAERLGFADEFLARLIRCPDPEKSLEGAPGGETAVARLVRTRSKREYTLAFNALADNGPVLYELFHQLASDPEADLDRWYEQLKHFVPADLLVPFFRVLRGDGPRVDSAALAPIAARGPGCLKMLLRTAAATGRLEAVLPGYGALLARRNVPDRLFWALELLALEPAHAGDQGVVDGLLMLLDEPPRYLESAAAGDWAKYQEAYEELCALPGAAEPVAARLTAHLGAWHWQTDPRLAAAVVGLVSVHEDVPELARVVLAGRAVEPALIEDERYAAWRSRVLARLPELEAEEVPLVLTGLPPDAGPDHVARLCAEAIDRRVPLEEVVGHVARSRWRFTGDRAVHLLNGIRPAFMRLGWSRREAEEFALALGRALVRTLHPNLVEEIRARTERETLLEIEYQYQLLQNIMMDPLDDEVLYLSDRTRGELEELAAWVLSLARSGRSRTWFG